MPCRSWPRRSLLIAPLLAAACAREQITEEGGRYRGPPLPRPERIFIADLGVMADDVKLDEGVRARLMREISSEPVSEQRVAAGREAAGTVTEEIAARLRGFGLPAVRASTTPPRLAVPNVVVEGHILSVDQGNGTRRTILGFGQGESRVVVEVQAYFRDGAARPRLIDQFEAAAESPRTPGLLGVGAGAMAGRAVEAAAASGALHTITELRSAETGTEGRRIGDALALRLGKRFAELGWIPASAVR